MFLVARINLLIVYLKQFTDLCSINEGKDDDDNLQHWHGSFVKTANNQLITASPLYQKTRGQISKRHTFGITFSAVTR